MKQHTVRFLAVVFFVQLLGCSSTPETASSESPVVELPYSENHIDFTKYGRKSSCCTAKGRKIAIASGGPLSSKAGVEIFDKGGNIVDAAVATAFALAIERPHSCGIGGGGFLTAHFSQGKEKGAYFVDFRETAPKAASRNMFLDKKTGGVIPRASTIGGLAVATPGFVAGWYEIHQKWGKLPWKDVLQPAIRLAHDGFAVSEAFSDRLVSKHELLASDPVLKNILFSAYHEPIKPGGKLIQKDLAKTLTEIAKKGKAAFYSGDTAKRIAQTVKRAGGILTAEDLRDYQVRFQPPIRSLYRNYVLVMPPPPSAGGVLIAQMLNVLSGFDLTREASEHAHYINLMSEVMKRAYADRTIYVGDPAFFKATYQSIMSQEYADELRKEIASDKRTPSDQIRPKGEVLKGHGTTQLSIIDSEGNAISSTISINTAFGAALGVPTTGIWLNNTMDDFSLKPGEQNSYGLTGREGNSIAPGKRPVSSMTPTIVLDEVTQRPILALGGGGGSKIITGVMTVLLDDLIHYHDLKKAVFAPRVHHQWLPDKLDLENGFSGETLQKLREMGHEMAAPNWLNEIQAVQFDPATGELMAVNDPRHLGGAEAK